MRWWPGKRGEDTNPAETRQSVSNLIHDLRGLTKDLNTEVTRLNEATGRADRER